MKNIVKIDGVEYIKKSAYTKLEKKKVQIKIVKKIVEKIVEKEKEDITFLQDYSILDPANVCGIFPFIKRNSEDIEELDTPMGFFKKVKEVEITSKYNEKWDVEVLNINGSRYSKEYVDQMKKLGGVWFSDIPEVYMYYDKEKSEFIKNAPLMFIFGESMCLILAPRVESDDDEEVSLKGEKK